MRINLRSRFLFSGKRDRDMTQGSIFLNLLLFAMPLLVGNLFQQLYNTVDTWVVGNYVSNEAFSAVGSFAPATNTLIGVFTGLASGAGVVISQYYGAKRFDDVEEAVHTSVAATLILSVVLSIAGIALIPGMMVWMKIPPEVQPSAVVYMTIYFAGLTGQLIYNMGSGILRAVGDSVRPFWYLVICTVVNIVLDLVLVLVFRMGVAGVALATVIAQFISAAMVTRDLLCTGSCVKITLKKIHLNREILNKICAIGIPGAIQIVTMSLSNMFAYSYINVFGPDCMSGWTAYIRIEQLVALANQSLNLAITTFVGQNIGGGDIRRAKSGILACFLADVGVNIILIVPIVRFAPQLVGFFNSKPEVVAYGAEIVQGLMPLYVANCVSLTLSGALRGAGKTKIPTLFMFLTLVVARQSYLLVASRLTAGAILPIVFCFPVGWISYAVLTYIYYKCTKLESDTVTG